MYRALTAEASPQSLVNLCAICDDRVAEGQVFDQPSHTSVHQCTILIFVYMLVLLEGQMSEDWEPSQSNAVSEIGERWVAE
jgi:hypothetical protein